MARMKQKLYESIYFAQGDDADEVLNIFHDEGETAAMEYLKQWHYPGEHETRSGHGAGSNDYLHIADNYYLVINTSLNYAGLSYKKA